MELSELWKEPLKKWNQGHWDEPRSDIGTILPPPDSDMLYQFYPWKTELHNAHLPNWLASQSSGVSFEQHSSNCSGIISPFIPLGSWTVSPQRLIREWFCANKRDSKIPKSNPRRFQERISSVKATGNLITVVAQATETFDTITKVHMQSMCVHTSLKRQSDTFRIYGIQEIKKHSSSIWKQWKTALVILSVCVLVRSLLEY